VRGGHSGTGRASPPSRAQFLGQGSVGSGSEPSHCLPAAACISTRLSASLSDGRSWTAFGDRAAATAEYKERIEDLTDSTNALATRVRNKLTSLDQDLKAMLQRDSSAAQQSDYKIRRNMHATLTKKFMDQMQDYQEAQSKYKRNVEETVKRQFRIVKPDASEAEVAEVLENGGQGIFTENMLASQNARSALEDVQEKHKDIQRLESSIQELHQLFVDLSVLVESQGELLNDIEHNVGTSVEYMKSGVGELVKANDYAAKSRKKMCCLIMFFVIVAAVTVLPSLL
jgi:t-SNARE complex subunit (syntaxin)